MLESRKLEDWDYDFLKSIYDASLKEWTTLDYKRDFPANNVEKNKLEQTVCAFANTRGGYILIGIEADQTENIPIAMNGITDEEGLYERVTSFCSRITPRITPRIHKVRIQDGNKIVLVIYVPESNEAHMTSDGKYYVRVNAQNLPADHYTVQKLFKKEYEIKEKMNEIIESRKQDFSGSGWIVVFVLPFGFKENLIPIFDENSGKMKKDTVDFLMNNKPFTLSSYKPTQFSFLQYCLDKEDKIWSFVEVSHNGFIEVGTVLFNETSIGLLWIKDNLREALEFASKVYSFSGHDGAVRFVLYLTSIKGRNLESETSDDLQRFRYKYDADHLVVQRDVAISDIKNNIDAIMSSVAAELMRSFGAEAYDK